MSIWKTPEVDAWSRGFNYSDYLNLHSLYNLKSKPLSIQAWWKICEAMEIQMELEIGEK